MRKRPVVSIFGWLFIVTGVMGFAFQFSALINWRSLHYDTVLIEFVRLLAVVAGVFILRGRNWARWLALAWMVFHVIVSAFHSLPEVAMHSLLCAACWYFLWRGDGGKYFRAVP